MFFALIDDCDAIGKTVHEAQTELDAQGFYELLDRMQQTGEPFLGSEVPVVLSGTGGLSKTRYCTVDEQVIAHHG